MRQTISEKILAEASGSQEVKPGDFVKTEVDVALNHDVTSVIAFEAMKKMGRKSVWCPDKIVIVLDHVSPPSSINSARVHKIIRKFAHEQGIENFFDIGSGVCHQVLPEKGFVQPGKVVIGADSHTCTHGAFGAFATGVGSTDMGAILATGKTWLKVPETINVEINGKTQDFVQAKDLILRTAKQIGVSGATYMALEFTGEAVRELSIAGRMTLCNMAIELGAKNGIIEPDKFTFDWLKDRIEVECSPIYSDKNAYYSKKVEIDITDMGPQVACPHNVDNVKPVSELDVKIDQSFIGSCTNGRLEDIKQAHAILKGRTIHKDVRLLISPASREIYKESLELGIISDLLDAGAVILNPGCTACFGGHIGLLGPGEVGISTSNRNFRGRQGSPEANVYLSNASVAAASALTGFITHPKEVS
jgi:3-isopropylmalate/(R)-2-methylmalate dehydratase large subunit